jgi:hypothetical protein
MAEDCGTLPSIYITFNAPSLMALIDWRDDPRAARTDPRLHPDQARGMLASRVSNWLRRHF